MRTSGDGDDRDSGTTVEVTGVLQKQAWGERLLPPVERLNGDIRSVPVPIPDNPLRYTLSYLVPGDAGLVVVDPGWDSEAGWAALTRGLATMGASPEDVTGIVATHVHPDHHGMTARLKSAGDAWVAMHPAERDTLPRRQTAPGASPRTAARTWLVHRGAPEEDVRDLLGPAPDAEDAYAFGLVEPDLLLEDKDVVPLAGRELVALWTPGHTPGHLCLVDQASRSVLTGDHVLPRITPNIGLHGQRPRQKPLAEFLDSLDRLASFDDHEALPAHEYRFRGLAARTRQLRDHHAERLEELLTVVGGLGRPTPWEVAAHLSWARPWHKVGPMRFAALAETEAHVQYLVDQGLLTRTGDDDPPVRVGRTPVT
ncbi:Zn-dependent hydrolase [Streptomyces sp. MNU77]|uniref:MBL fold metallo-hydrolase n=1 Tax=Streptomyces sp. MNU77 TaxID=1573406 RepID=UPI00063FFEFD|nr:MBL fold metallo-hydrolase [Streptomyces sp. MNU77]OLO25735.1 Zn-dependent hydrolase [Streptomyces sp. MNU77]